MKSSRCCVKLVRYSPPDAILGQYVRGTIDGGAAPGYREEKGISPESSTETFIALKLEIGNRRWRNVPFFLRTGKRMPYRCTRIAIYFRNAGASIFNRFNASSGIKTNVLTITIQPDEVFSLEFNMKTPGKPFKLSRQQMQFRYADAFDDIPEAYETLIYDVLAGEQTLFVCDDEVEQSWRIYDDLLRDEHEVYPYPSGSWGPKEIKRLKANWLNPRD
ncbi:hypothetical protein ACFLU4_00200 [Chloroflexota bacterium]